jgi:RimJ/RimL family protein N-acetyltransferase
MHLQPTLQGDSLRLLPLQPDHLAALTQAAADPLIWQLHPEPTRYLPEVFRAVFDSGLACGGAFLITDKHSGEVLGTSRYYDYDPKAKAVAIGYTFLVRSRWGGATNSELKQLMLDYAFLHVDTVWFHVGEQNLRSRRAVEKLGARYSHTEQTTPQGQSSTAPRNTVFYRLERPWWQQATR